MPSAEQLTEVVAVHGEGPVWDDAAQQLLCVDLTEGALLRVDHITGAVRRSQVSSVLAALRPRRSGGWVLALERGFALTDTGWDDEPRVRALPQLWSDPGVRMNEGGCDPAGRFWCGSMAYDQSEGAGTLWRLDPDGSASAALRGVTVSNGLAWSPDGSVAYYNDTPTGRTDVLQVDADTGEVTGRRPFATAPEGDGMPDGLVVDAEGGVWTALYGGGAVVRYGPDGTLTERVDVPTPHVTACTFGGPGLATLFITTSTEGLDREQEPQAGALFHHEPGVRGQLPLTFAG
ncbi:SMP-30/gluconolactonase/LRE family protein [Quadrisphaera sp. DSM 44207]|uniref:SMP-30/gluconolactonase/LRE family protein n=1 Tax=Quadrisphaera sp. DSM 44207 TaxID=1881057 RepID=UPI00089120B6|nr:SMP-30/gluconolactonase/LRE family protein [Quadrisphaera sp. DSM 44207]SDQ11255.1 Sugar lactone lactonase YvrE [Quadrisphaera sp. DSM 44207]